MSLTKFAFVAASLTLLSRSEAQGADLAGIKKSTPAEYVRVCDEYGAGFFYIPGTQTCLKVGGRARFEYQFQQPVDANDGNTSGGGFRAIGRLMLDARSQSELGPLRAFVRIDTHYRTGALATGSAERYGISTARQSAEGYGQKQTVFDLESAFVQLSGFTAGRLISFFEFGSDQSFQGTGGVLGYAVTQFAYTAQLGSGFSATLAVEDPVNRRQGIMYNSSGLNNVTIGAAGIGATTAAGRSLYGGNKALPDLVGVLRLDRSWGAAQISSVLHSLNYGYQSNGVNPDTDYGFAVQGAVKINLPVVSAGDALWLQGAYTRGVLQTIISSYCGYGLPVASLCGGGKATGFAGNLVAADAVYGGRPGLGFTPKLTTGYALLAALQHYWTPTIRSSFTGSFTVVNYATATNIADMYLWLGAFNTTWSPIPGLDIGAEAQYSNVRGAQGVNGNLITRFSTGSGGAREDQWNFMLRVQRDF